MKITFLGAARTVTGSKHLIELDSGRRILLDCGLVQNKGSDNDSLNRHLGFDPASIDAVILSHAHIDHSGNLPNLCRQGYRGPIYATPATIDLCEVMLEDSAHIQESDIEYLNRKRLKNGQRPLEPLYTPDDVKECVKLFVPVDYLQWKKLFDDFSFEFTDAGHIIGSAAVSILAGEPPNPVRICFSGDVGRYGDIILPAPSPFPQADYILCESTYGHRLHETAPDAEEHLLAIVEDTCVRKKGKLIIPAFSLGRTQEIMYALDRLKTNGRLPSIPVYVDSPLAISATTIMRKYAHCFNDSIKEYMKRDADPFGFENAFYIRKADDSKKLNDQDEPCIIISASGMMEAGRIKHHIKNNIEDSRCTLLIVGYVPPQSLGGRLIAGEKEVRIFGKPYTVACDIRVMDSYSAHADYNELLRFLSCQDRSQLKSVFLVHGEDEAMEGFQRRLLDSGYSKVILPESGETFELGG